MDSYNKSEIKSVGSSLQSTLLGKSVGQILGETTEDREEPLKLSGAEPFLGVYTQTQVVLIGVRLTFDERVYQQLADVAAQVETARRTFIHSADVVSAIQDVTRITATYNQRVQTWESEARRREANKKDMSGATIAKMNAEHGRVRTKASLGNRALTKLMVELHQLSGSKDWEDTMRRARDDSQRLVDDVVVDSKAPEAVAKNEPKEKPEFTERQIQMATSSASRVLEELMQDGFAVDFEAADRQVEGSERREQIWDAKHPFVVAVAWDVDRTTAGFESELDRALGRAAGSGKKQLHLTLWLVPKTSSAVRVLRAAASRLGLVVEGRGIDPLDLTFSLAESDERPRSTVIASFVERIEARLDEGNIPLPLLVASLRNLDWSQGRLLLSTK